LNVNREAYQKISEELKKKNIALVAVSKTKPVSDILELYNLGHRDFGENYVQEMIAKQSELPADIRWHYIGHLQSNKVKQLIPFIHLIQSVDSLKLLKEINKQSAKNSRVTDVLLQVHIAQEETKFGFDRNELEIIFNTNPDELKNTNIIGLMGMASFTDEMEKVKAEFRTLKSIFDKFKSENKSFKILSMGMSSDYKIAIEEGSNMVRIGSLLFGER
jgi:PLP dependent protein